MDRAVKHGSCQSYFYHFSTFLKSELIRDQTSGIQSNDSCMNSVAKRKLVEPSGIEPLTSDRKSTRLNSSHVRISYAVFCLKKKNKQKKQIHSCGSHTTSVVGSGSSGSRPAAADHAHYGAGAPVRRLIGERRGHGPRRPLAP